MSLDRIGGGAIDRGQVDSAGVQGADAAEGAQVAQGTRGAGPEGAAEATGQATGPAAPRAAGSRAGVHFGAWHTGRVTLSKQGKTSIILEGLVSRSLGATVRIEGALRMNQAKPGPVLVALQPVQQHAEPDRPMSLPERRSLANALQREIDEGSPRADQIKLALDALRMRMPLG